MSSEGTNRCSFCGRTADQLGVLVQGLNAAICDDCVKAALSLVEERQRRPDSGRADGRIDITDYEPDVELALLIGKAAMRTYCFVPLAANPNEIVLAVTGLNSYDHIRTIVREATVHASGLRKSAEKMNLVWADREAILDKISRLSKS